MTFSSCLFIILLLCVSCTSNESVKSKVIYDANKEYLSAKTYFESNYIDHFPAKIEEFPTQLKVDTNDVPDHVRIILYYWRSNSFVDSLIGVYNKRKVKAYSANENCLLVVNRFTIKENWHLRNKYKYVNKDKISRTCYSDKYPIPNFWDSPYVTNDTESRLPEDFDIYVLEAKSGKFWDEVQSKNGKYMPEEWKNGYSKGVAISKIKNVIIYWFIIW